MECCQYDMYYPKQPLLAYEMLRYCSAGFSVHVTAYASDGSICFAKFAGNNRVFRAHISRERLSSVIASRNAANPDALTIYGLEEMYRTASAYYPGIPAMEDCEYRMECLNDCSVSESIVFHFSGLRVWVTVNGDGRFLSFSEFDAENRLVFHDCLMQ